MSHPPSQIVMSKAHSECDRQCERSFDVNGGCSGDPAVDIKEAYSSENLRFCFNCIVKCSNLTHSLYLPRPVSSRSIAIMFFTLALPSLTLFLPIHSAPAPQDLSSAPEYLGNWQITGAPPVTSDPLSPTSLMAPDSQSTGVAIPEGFSLGANPRVYP